MKIGVTVKGCDAMAFYELAKRQQINLDNIIMIGVNCGGSVSPVLARKMIVDKFGVDPDKVHKEEIDKGQFIIEYEGGHKGISIDELEEAGYGRRPNCRRCKMKIPGRLILPVVTGELLVKKPEKPLLWRYVVKRGRCLSMVHRRRKYQYRESKPEGS